ncbi:hypothetical protein Hypma_015378 [Hypsizygus marmoreus]|uniref:Uncharacterized protein n=1 Tax=Hypsizygus marmoreus TaxID=39966 RepID=A0A369K6G1_HYPMA|nr:hypothetical protein Hypma_015378 [Hypsizygus marmoreus]
MDLYVVYQIAGYACVELYQIKRWFAYQHSKDIGAKPKEPGLEEAWLVLLHRLTGVGLTKPRRTTAFNHWFKANKDFIDKEIRKATTIDTQGRKAARNRNKVVSRLFKSLDKEQQKRWEDASFVAHQAKLAKWEIKTSGPLSTLLVDRQAPDKAMLIAGGPEPADGGRLNVISVHSGCTSGNISMNFGRSERHAYKTQFLPLYGKFLKKCYTVDECRSRTLIPSEDAPPAREVQHDDLDEFEATYDSLGDLLELGLDGANTPLPRSTPPLVHSTTSSTLSLSLTVAMGSTVPSADAPPASQPPTSTPVSPAVSPVPSRAGSPTPTGSTPSTPISHRIPFQLSWTPPPHSPFLPRTLAPELSTSVSAPSLRTPAPASPGVDAPTPPPPSPPPPSPVSSPPRPFLPLPPSSHTASAAPTSTAVGKENVIPPQEDLDGSLDLGGKRPRDDTGNGADQAPSVQGGAKRRRRMKNVSPTLRPTNHPRKVPLGQVTAASSSTTPHSSTTRRPSTQNTSSASAPVRASAPTLTSSTIDRLGDASAPAWFSQALGMFQSENLGDKWTALLRVWAAFQSREKYVNNGLLPARKRPACVGDWIARARAPGYRPTVKLSTFEVDFRAWWKGIQPKWRVSPDDYVLTNHLVGDWFVLRLSGTNGVLSIVACLFFWGVAVAGQAPPGRRAEWERAVADVEAVFRVL